jgi:protein required for attachment to host cells
MMRISKNTLVVAADGQNAFFYRNVGVGGVVSLELLHHMGLNNSMTQDLGTGRPGQSRVSVNGQRSSFEQVDFHQRNETDFLKGAAKVMSQTVAEHRFTEIVLIAEPTALGVLRVEVSPSTMSLVKTQIDKDYTKMSEPELSAILQAL